MPYSIFCINIDSVLKTTEIEFERLVSVVQCYVFQLRYNEEKETVMSTKENKGKLVLEDGKNTKVGFESLHLY